MSILDFFGDMMVPGTPYGVTLAPDSTGNWVETETEGTAINGVFWETAEVPTFYQKTWMINVDAVFAVRSTTGLSDNDYIVINSVKYTANTIQDPVNNNVTGFDNMYLVGLVVKI